MRRFLSCLVGLTLAGVPLAAQTLGQIDFPNSGKPGAQAPFLRGVLLLHSFEYEDAASAFREAQRLDPGFALAYWGEAMTYTHPLWNQQDQSAARAALERLGTTGQARRAKAGSEREQLYLETAEVLYMGEGSKPRRDTLHSRAFERLSQRYPDDVEAQAFYALSLMGLSQSVRNVSTYMRAGAIAQEIYRRNPRHPGALHYIIHAFDDPVHAPLGLHAAREYSVIAADADHAQHMTTHIFLALGMWPETVRQNTIASGPDSSHWAPGHYTAWLGYALLQQGKYDAARIHLQRVRGNLATPARPGQQAHLLTMRAHYLVNSERWNDSVTGWQLEDGVAGTLARAADAYALGLAQLRRGDRPGAEATLGRLDQLAAKADNNESYGGNAAVPSVLARQLRALLAWQDGRKEEALGLLHQAAAAEDGFPAEFGPPDIVKPTHELLGELLLALDRPADAQGEFQRALELAPGRLRALAGLERAARAAGDAAVADRAATTLAANRR